MFFLHSLTSPAWATPPSPLHLDGLRMALLLPPLLQAPSLWSPHGAARVPLLDKLAAGFLACPESKPRLYLKGCAPCHPWASTPFPTNHTGALRYPLPIALFPHILQDSLLLQGLFQASSPQTPSFTAWLQSWAPGPPPPHLSGFLLSTPPCLRAGTVIWQLLLHLHPTT